MRALAAAFVVLVAAPVHGIDAAPEPLVPAVQGELPITAASPEARAAFSRGRSLYFNLRTAEAREALQEAVRLDPGCAQAHVYLAIASRPPARDSIERAVRLRSKVTDGEALLIDAVAAQVHGDTQAELQARRALVNMFPRDWRVLVGLGNRLGYLGRHEEALEVLRRAVQVAPDEAAPLNDLGYVLAELGKLDEAVRTLKRYAEMLPSEPNPHDSLAEILLRAGKVGEAVAEYRRALEADATFVVANEGVGHALLLSGDFDAARAAYGRWAEFAETPWERLSALGWLAATYAHEGRIDETLRQLERAEARALQAREPSWSLLFPLRRSLALSEVGRVKEAAALADTVARKVPSAPLTAALRTDLGLRALFARGVAHARAGDVAGAGAALRSFDERVKKERVEVPQLRGLAWILRAEIALRGEPDRADAATLETGGLESDPWGLAVVADAMEHVGRVQDANRLRQQALALNIVTPELGFVRPRLMGGGSLRAGTHHGLVPVTTSSSAALALFDEARRLGEAYKRSVAIAALDRAIELDPEFALARCYRAVFAESPEEAGDHLQRAVRLAAASRTSRGERLFIEAHAAERAGDTATKEKKLRELAQMYPNDWRAAAYLGEHLLRMGRAADAIPVLQDAVARAPGAAYPYNGLGYALAREGRLDEAVQALSKYVDLSPGESNPHDSLAEIFLMAGRAKEAEAEYRRSLELSPQFTASWEGLGHARLLAGDFDGAREAWRTMFEKAGLGMDRVAARTWRALSFAVEGRLAESAQALAVAEIEADEERNGLGSALLAARRAAIMAEAGRAKDGVLLANATLKRASRLSPAGRAMVERAALFGRGWAQLVDGDVKGAEATARELQSVADKSGNPEAVELARALGGAVALQAGRAADAAKLLAGAARRDPLGQALLAEAFNATGESEKSAAALLLARTPVANDYLLPLAVARIKRIAASREAAK